MDDSRIGGCDLVELRARTARLSESALSAATGRDDDALARIAALEELRSMVAAMQAVEVAALVAERRAAAEVEIATVPRPGVGRRRRREEAARRVVAEIGRARRVSPWAATRFVAFACQAPVDTPETFALLAAGRLSERRAVLVLNAVTPLTTAQRRRVDTELAPELPGWGDRQVDHRARAAVYAVDPAGACERNAYAKEQRRVSLRPAPECMAWLTALVPMTQGIAAKVALEQAVRNANAAGDLRTRGAVMADTLVERITGQAAADAVPVAVQVVITDRTLAGGDDPARFADGEPVPAPLARDLCLGPAARTTTSTAPGTAPGTASGAADDQVRRTVRRLFTDPAGRLVAMEIRSRHFTAAQAELIRLRDGICTTPWCDAPIQDIDHDHPHVRGGPTSTDNGRGLCRWCNVTKGDRPPEPATPPAITCAPPRSRVERRARRHLHRHIAAASRRPALVVDLPPHRCTMQQ